MAEKPKNSNSPRRDMGFVRGFIDQIRLSWALFSDNRVPVYLKAIPVVALIYVVSPLDLIPDIIPVLGQLDDIGVIMVALNLFNNMVPSELVAEHAARLHTGNQPRVTHDEHGTVIDTKADRVTTNKT